MPTTPALQNFVDDELMRAPLLAEQVIEDTLTVIAREGKTASPRERMLVTDIQRALLNHRPLVVREFTQSLTDNVRREMAGHAERGGKPALPSGPGALSLVDETQVEVDVEVSRAIEAIRSVAEHELREVMSFTSALVGDMDVARDYNPMRPEILVRSLWEAAQALPLQRAFQLAFLHHACMPLAHQARRTYAGACSRLESQGVEPAVYRTIIIAGSRRSRGRQDSFFDTASNRVESSTRLPGAGSMRTTSGVISGNATTLPPPGTAASRESVDQVLARADRLMRNLPADVTRGQRDDLRDRQQQALLNSAEQPAERELIDLINRLFDALLGDRRLETDIQNIISRLQAPALRLALRDPSTLDNYTHPVWLLMDRMALQGETHPPPEDPGRTRMLRFMHGVLDALTQEQAKDSDVFRWARERVMAYERHRFEERRKACELELQQLQALEDKLVKGDAPPTAPGALDVGQLDTVPAELLDDLVAAHADTQPTDSALWLQSRRSGEWVHMFMQGGWVNAQLIWYGPQREYWLFADGASPNTWAIRRRALERMHDSQLLDTLAPRSLIREAAGRVLRNLDA